MNQKSVPLWTTLALLTVGLGVFMKALIGFSAASADPLTSDSGNETDNLSPQLSVLCPNVGDKKRTPKIASHTKDLSACYATLTEEGNEFLLQGEFSEAQRLYRASLEIAEKLVQQDSSNNQWQKELSNSYENLGNSSRRAFPGF